MALIQINVPDDVKARADAAFARNGITTPAAMKMMVTQVAHENRTPFDGVFSSPAARELGEDVRRDMLAFFNGLVPRLGDYHHAEGNSDAHIKATLHGPSLTLFVENGELCLGTWQSVYLCEGDGPRRRSIWLQWLAGQEE